MVNGPYIRSAISLKLLSAARNVVSLNYWTNLFEIHACINESKLKKYFFSGPSLILLYLISVNRTYFVSSLEIAISS